LVYVTKHTKMPLIRCLNVMPEISKSYEAHVTWNIYTLMSLGKHICRFFTTVPYKVNL